MTKAEAMQQLARLMAVFPRHGLNDVGVVEYADSMCTLFAGEWHMRAVIDEAKRKFEFFPSIAQLAEFADSVSARRASLSGCPNCIRSSPGMAYQIALYTPGNAEKPGRIEKITEEAAETLRPMIAAQIETARGRGSAYEGQRIIERHEINAAVGYCDCPAGIQLRQARLQQQAIDAEKRASRNGGLRRATRNHETS